MKSLTEPWSGVRAAAPTGKSAEPKPAQLLLFGKPRRAFLCDNNRIIYDQMGFFFSVVVSHDASACSSEPAAAPVQESRGTSFSAEVNVLPVCLSFFQVLTYRNRIDELQKQ